MKRVLFLLLIIVVTLLPLNALAITKASGSITMEFDLSARSPNKEARLWIPYPVSDSDQLITAMKISGDYAEAAVYTDKKYSTPMLYARWNAGERSRKLVMSFTSERNEVVKKEFPKVEGPWDPRDYSLYLAATSRGPIDGPVSDLAQKIIGDRNTVYGKAKAIYDWICDNMYRDPTTQGCGPGDVCSLLITPGGKCTDIHSVFVALCRAVGVPAREIFGIRLGKKEVEDISKWQHCWAEFFLPGYGWVPVDPADVRKMMLKNNLAQGDAKALEYREYFWGAWDAYRVKLSVGRDLMLNPVQQGDPLNTFGYPYAEIGGKTLNWLDPSNFSYKITYRQ